LAWVEVSRKRGAHCREVVVETASTRGERPKLRGTLDRLQAGDTLVIYKPDRVARSMKELLVLVEDELHARGVVLEILTGVCAGVHRPDGAGLADRLLFAVAALAVPSIRRYPPCATRRTRRPRVGGRCASAPARRTRTAHPSGSRAAATTGPPQPPALPTHRPARTPATAACTAAPPRPVRCGRCGTYAGTPHPHWSA
jgi:Resolvase, N terminal domain